MQIALAEQQFEVATPTPIFELIQGGRETMPPSGQLHVVETSLGHETVAFPGVMKVSEIPGDAELVAQARRNIQTRLVGDFAVEETIDVKEKPIKNLREGIVWARRGDAEGIAMVDANVGTEMIEQAYKAGNVVTIDLEVKPNDIYQNGQPMSDVARNAYHLASADSIIKPRTVAEANNMPRMKRLYDMGLLEDNVYVRFSMCAEGVSDEKLDKLKFFSSTKSISVQMAYSENGQLFDEVAMVAGAISKDAPRHDREMIESVAEYFGKSYKDMPAPEIIDDGMLIPKKYVKNGVVDIVKIMDDIKGTFFGQNKPRQNYVKFKASCEQREARFKDDVVVVRNQLITGIDKLTTALAASKRLAKLVERRMVDKALNDTSIDPNVFGPVSAASLFKARELKAARNYHEAQAFMQHARATAKGGSCPSADEALSALQGRSAANSETKSESSSGSDQYGSLTFECQNGHENTRPRGQLIPCCKTCGISVKC